jgi:hypothetical protein
MPRLRLYVALALPMGVAKLISQAREISDNRLAVAENAFKHGFAMLTRRQLQASGGGSVQLGKVIILTVLIARFVNYMFTNSFEQRFGAPSGSDVLRSSAFCQA